jgi:organic hydroperoxide reductase OsmC/OhrA
VQFGFEVVLTWTGQPNPGEPFDHYSARSRREPVVPGTSQPCPPSDRDRPQDLLIGALAQDHLVAFLHLANARGINVVDYIDHATGWHTIPPGRGRGHGRISRVVLRPRVRVLGEQPLPDGSPVTGELLAELHDSALREGIVAQSVGFPVLVMPEPLTGRR